MICMSAEAACRKDSEERHFPIGLGICTAERWERTYHDRIKEIETERAAALCFYVQARTEETCCLSGARAARWVRKRYFSCLICPLNK